ncbi:MULTISPECIES: STAS domain-containing protein [unclassified Iodobacter]|uniref:STAS domain-containing protein n=1 Tax=unclassified Iodobacter TaxID=235634 RepID=UPI0025D53772|nr:MULTISPECIES: STAS domain-containing protein [unclassified Iodobacter]MDW5417638.1 STAS domain-containing protein [Iodobacter sp. CM08]
MSLLLEHQNGQTLARLQGELTIFNAADVQDDLLSLLNHEEVMLDLSEVSELDGCGAQLLAILQAEAMNAGKSIALFTLDPAMKHTLQYLGVTVCSSLPTEASHDGS